MSCLDATFTLTPKAPWYFGGARNYAGFNCYGADFLTDDPYNFSALYDTDRFHFSYGTHGNAGVDYSVWGNRIKVPHLHLFFDLGSFGAHKQLALVVGFDTIPAWLFLGRVLVYTDAGLLHDQTLAVGDNQFLVEVESLDDYVNLYFIHAYSSWFFRGFSGYVV